PIANMPKTTRAEGLARRFCHALAEETASCAPRRSFPRRFPHRRKRRPWRSRLTGSDAIQFVAPAGTESGPLAMRSAGAARTLARRLVDPLRAVAASRVADDRTMRTQKAPVIAD